MDWRRDSYLHRPVNKYAMARVDVMKDDASGQDSFAAYASFVYRAFLGKGLRKRNRSVSGKKKG